MAPRDTQVVELIGRNWLAAQLFAAGVEVARPERDRGVDLIAYVERSEAFHAVPIQLKAAMGFRFVIDRKYARAPSLLLAYVCSLDDPARTECYATTHDEGVAIAERIGWTKNDSWTVHGQWSAGALTKQLAAELTPYRMDADAWRARVAGEWVAARTPQPMTASDQFRAAMEADPP